MKHVSIFVLGYRSLAFLQGGTLSSVEAAARRLELEGYEVSLVFLDNYSRDGSVQWVMAHHPDADVLLAPTNYLYCKGTNVGLQYCERRYRPDYFLLVDADNFAEPDAYAELLAYAEAHPRAGLVQPLVRGHEDHSVLYSCGHRFLDDGQCRPMQELPADLSALDDLVSCSISSTLVRREVFEACGLLDPVYDIYFESSDLSFRARRAGFRCACHVGAVTYNEGTDGAGVDRFHNRYYFNRNRLVFWKLHDEARFRHVREIQEDIYRGLQAEFEASEYGLDVEREAVRKGIEDGLRLTDDPLLPHRPPVALADFDKSAVVVLQSGRPAGPR